VKDTAVWASPTPNKNINIRDEEENLIHVHQVGHQVVAADGDRCPAIAGYAVRSRRAGDGIRRATEVLVVGQGKAAAAVGGEQTDDRFGHA